MKYSIVLGSQFGDEGKGSFTNWLCEESISQDYNPIVIRFNGGHQAGHTVLHNGIRHTFSSFGSATLQNVPTFWAEYCTVYPIAMLNEWKVLKSLNVKPDIYFDPLCPVTTPYDVFANIDLESQTKHGSVGVGFGTTIQRHESYYKLYFQDLFNKTVLKAKMNNIKNYYKNIIKIFPSDILSDWYTAIDILISDGIISKSKIGFNAIRQSANTHYIFEGAQGILLDMDFGFFPNVTRSNTTSKNAFEFMRKHNLLQEQSTSSIDGEIFYITRPYQTRHGMGFMSNRDLPEPKLINNENEINVDTSFQGIFRKSVLDLDLLSYAIECDDYFITMDYPPTKNLVITCLDQIGSEIDFTLKGSFHRKDIETFKFNINQLTGISQFMLGYQEGKFKHSICQPYFRQSISL